jgi:hypothetical protein
MTDELDACISEDVRGRSIPSGSELALLFQDSLRVISCADERQIAVLGVESFLAQPDGLLVTGYSGYDFSFDGEDWTGFVKVNNLHAMKFFEGQVDREKRHFILTGTSRREYGNLRTLGSQR